MINMTCDSCWKSMQETEPYVVISLEAKNNTTGPTRVRVTKTQHICMKCVDAKRYWNIENPTWNEAKEENMKKLEEAARAARIAQEAADVPAIVKGTP